jgi:creatinine amidohydrolase
MDKKNGVLYFEKLSWKQIDALDRQKTIFFLPISLLEEHGPHLPIGMDFITSKDVATEAIRIMQKKKSDIVGVLFPPIPLGMSKGNSDFPGTISTHGKIIREVIFSISASLAKDGFKNLMICSWHLDFNHLKGIFQGMHKARKKLNMNVHEPTGPYFWLKKVDEWDEELKKKGHNFDFDPDKQFHGGFRETSIMIYKHPDLVNKIYNELPTVYKNLMSKECKGKQFREMGIKDGYVGSPKGANTEYGRLHFEDIANLYADQAIKMYEGKELLEMPKKFQTFMKLPFF